MILDFVLTAWNMALAFVFIVLPIAFLIGFFGKLLENKREENEAKRLEAEANEPKAEQANVPKPEVYKTVKKEPGSYLVVGPDATEAIVVRVTVPNEGNFWVAALAVKNSVHSDRVLTKKEAVKLAIEMLKEHKEKKNGS